MCLLEFRYVLIRRYENKWGSSTPLHRAIDTNFRAGFHWIFLSWETICISISKLLRIFSTISKRWHKFLICHYVDRVLLNVNIFLFPFNGFSLNNDLPTPSLAGFFKPWQRLFSFEWVCPERLSSSDSRPGKGFNIACVAELQTEP
jgi:hypothetical protein